MSAFYETLPLIFLSYSPDIISWEHCQCGAVIQYDMEFFHNVAETVTRNSLAWVVCEGMQLVCWGSCLK